MSNITNEQYAQLYRDLDQQRRNAGAAQRDKFSCCICGSEDGMMSVHRDTLAEMRMRDWPTVLYQHYRIEDYLYHTCPECKRAYHAVLPEYKLLSRKGIFDWVHRSTE